MPNSYSCVTRSWKIDRIVTFMEFHFIDTAISYTIALSINSVTEDLGQLVCFLWQLLSKTVESRMARMAPILGTNWISWTRDSSHCQLDDS